MAGKAESETDSIHMSGLMVGLLRWWGFFDFFWWGFGVFFI